MICEHHEDGFYESFPDYGTIRNVLEVCCKKYSSSIAFSYAGKDGAEVEITYGQFWEEIQKTAAQIRQEYERQKHVGVVCQNSYATIVVIYGIICAGKVAVLTEPSINVENLMELLDQTDTTCVLIPEETKLSELEIQNQTVEELLEKSRKRNLSQADTMIQIEPNDTAFILFTSGTTGNRHGVEITNQGMAVSIQGSAMHPLYDKKPRQLLILPLYHMYGLVALICHLAIGVKWCINANLKSLQKDLKKYQPKTIDCVPMMLDFLYKKINQNIDKMGKRKQFDTMRKLSDWLRRHNIHVERKLFASILEPLGGELEVIISGGAFLDKEIIEFFESVGIEIYEGYGLTETSTFVTVSTKRYRRVGALGIATPYNDIRIVDEEIQVRGCNIMKGYYGEEELAKASFDGEWFKTGDLGYISEDGFLYMTGRRKNLLILSNGQNISPEEIENELLKSDYIDEVVVSEKKGHIHAEIYTVLLEKQPLEELQIAVKKEIDKVNRKNSRERYVESFDLRKEPFDKTVTMKIKRG